MTQHELEIARNVTRMAEEQVLFLRSRYHMRAEEIIRLYTGEAPASATYDEAIQSIAFFNMDSASRNGFIAG